MNHEGMLTTGERGGERGRDGRHWLDKEVGIGIILPDRRTQCRGNCVNGTTSIRNKSRSQCGECEYENCKKCPALPLSQGSLKNPA